MIKRQNHRLNDIVDVAVLGCITFEFVNINRGNEWPVLDFAPVPADILIADRLRRDRFLCNPCGLATSTGTAGVRVRQNLSEVHA